MVLFIIQNAKETVFLTLREEYITSV